ncbi:DUF305 domain-containing protein [Streptomyces candidus]|uniref:Uncharacterized protein (DUF305 family) n=1 Tax=Streptomyces candidus TaxID=67283 RepID=A0A7X0HAC7_9ACTN|nr:DUF305 domain-containing protein [Streptomyces candidus]MBB6433880.1 uncharacterized protein (DUF305 family) [Streptomyces candidus]GHH34194.1 DUF305 domain-containing protein [Streptomyces candidus]
MSRSLWQALGAVVFALAVVAGAVTVTRAASASDARPAAAPGRASPPGDSADAGFARDMAAHHQQAVEMSFVVRDRTDDPDVRRLAYDIANTQANQRGMLLGWLDLWELPKIASPDAPPMGWLGGHRSHAGGAGAAEGLMPGMATRAQLKALGEAKGRAAEVLYLRLMTAHHKGGVTMAQGCARLCTVGAEKRLAQGMVDAQEAELNLMEGMLREREQ